MTNELSEYAIRLAKHVCHVSEKGLSDPIGWSTLAERFSPDDRSHMVEAAYELKHAGLLRISGGLNAPDGISHVRAEYDLYWLFDQDVFNYDIDDDVATLIELILEDERRGDAATLIVCTNMTPRRFNPAFARIAEEFPDGRQRNNLQPDYPVAGVLVSPEDRVRLKTLLREIRASTPEASSAPVDNVIDEPKANSRVKIKPPWIEIETEVPKWLAWVLGALAISVALFWLWPDIEQRLPGGFESETPILMEPADAVTLTAYPRIVNLSWQPLPDAVQYIVEVHAQDFDTNEWFSHPFQSRWNTSEPSLTFEFIGDQPGRWQVVAIDADNQRSQPSAWNEFFYETVAGLSERLGDTAVEPIISEQTINAVMRGCGGGWSNEVESTFREAIRLWSAETPSVGQARSRTIIAIIDELSDDASKAGAFDAYAACFERALNAVQ